MSVRVVRLGSARHASEGLRIGTVRRPPRGVARDRYAIDDWYDVWLPQLAPSAATVKLGLTAVSPREWQHYARRYLAEMAAPDNRHLIAVLAKMSQHADFSIGCYCADEARCHRTLLSRLLRDAGAQMAE